MASTTDTDFRTTYTIDSFISVGSANTVISYANLSFLEKLDSIEYPIFNVINDYVKELKLVAVDVKLTDKEYYKYAYRPKLLANDIYDNMELYFVILAINNLCNVKEFTLKTLKLLKKDDMTELMNEIYNSEKSSLSIYNSDI